MQKEIILIQDERFPVSFSKEYKDIYTTEISHLVWGYVMNNKRPELELREDSVYMFINYVHPDANIRESHRVTVEGEDFVKLNNFLENVVLRVHTKLFPDARK